MRHHDIFSQITQCEEGYFRTLVGAKYRQAFLSEEGFGHFKSLLPPLGEIYYEWVSLFESIKEAGDTYTIMELGAGFGPWLTNAACALRMFKDIPCKLIGVEADPIHFQWLKQTLIDNLIDVKNWELHEGALCQGNERVFLSVTNPELKLDPAAWYGQYIIPEPRVMANLKRDQQGEEFYGARRVIELNNGIKVIPVESVVLSQVLSQHDKVDYLFADLQGAEAEVFPPAARELDQKVRRVHLGTHGAEVEAVLRQLFEGLGWEKVWDFPTNSRDVKAREGVCSFADGILSYVNPKLDPQRLAAARAQGPQPDLVKTMVHHWHQMVRTLGQVYSDATDYNEDALVTFPIAYVLAVWDQISQGRGGAEAKGFLAQARQATASSGACPELCSDPGAFLGAVESLQARLRAGLEGPQEGHAGDARFVALAEGICQAVFGHRQEPFYLPLSLLLARVWKRMRADMQGAVDG